MKKNIGKMIDYQNGSIVSSEIMRKKTGTVTLFAFDKGQGLSEHTAPFDALVLVVDGKAEIKVDGENSLLETGEMIVMPAGRPHAVHAPERFKMILVMIKEGGIT